LSWPFALTVNTLPSRGRIDADACRSPRQHHYAFLLRLVSAQSSEWTRLRKNHRHADHTRRGNALPNSTLVTLTLNTVEDAAAGLQFLYLHALDAVDHTSDNVSAALKFLPQVQTGGRHMWWPPFKFLSTHS
jgi:hypothetical protein